MTVNLIIRIAASAFFGAVIYSLVVILSNLFAPIVAVIAGFICGTGLLILSDTSSETEKKITPAVLLYTGGAAVLSLFIGYIFLYYYKPVIIHNLTCHPHDFITFVDFMINSFQIPDIFCTIMGGMFVLALSDKIVLVYRYFRHSQSV
jgi:multisubunit Na+/H+ antiporter MnhB subunit